MGESCWSAVDRERVITEVAGELWRYVSARARPVELASRLLADVSGLGPTDLETMLAALRTFPGLLAPACG